MLTVNGIGPTSFGITSGASTKSLETMFLWKTNVNIKTATESTTSQRESKSVLYLIANEIPRLLELETLYKLPMHAGLHDQKQIACGRGKNEVEL